MTDEDGLKNSGDGEASAAVRVSRILRVLVQIFFVLLFFYLVRRTDDYLGQNQAVWTLDLFFRFDPLIAAAVWLATRSFISLLLPALAVVALTLALGRFFCGWVCPLGSLIDVSHHAIGTRRTGPAGRRRTWKYYLLVFILAGAFFHLPIVGYFDPFSILARGVVTSVDPAWNAAWSRPIGEEGQSPARRLAAKNEPLRNLILPYQQKHYTYSLVSLGVLALALGLSRLERRFWCRNLCPLGALLALFSRFSLLKLHPGRACRVKGCADCLELCRMGAINEEGKVSPEACNLCLDCLVACPRQNLSVRFKPTRVKPPAFEVSRRGFAVSFLSGLLLPGFLKGRADDKRLRPLLLRPPGALWEDEFLDRCVRCGACLKVCITNGLQPALWEAGLEGMMSPVLVPRLGYCEYHCTLCGQVCPTGAIAELSPAEKKTVKLGTAVFDLSLCKPWARGEFCIMCEEVCPVSDKAIKVREAVVKNQFDEEIEVLQPYVVEHLCVGCGQCEFVCPLPGESAVRVNRGGESRDPENQLYQFK